MDISNEATVLPFLIGPSSVVGRTIAFRILFFRSFAQLRHRLLYLLMFYLYKGKNILHRNVRPMLSWLHPRNPQGILVMMTGLAFLLRRYTNIKSKAETVYRKKFWKNLMRTALTYEEWAHAARMIDKENPKMNEAELYDEELVRNKLEELRHRRQEGSIRDIMFYMRSDLIRNLGNMCNPELHKDRLQVPKLIKDYIIEVSTQLRMVCDSDTQELLLEEKLAFMNETRHAFGRSALLLSGGASLGAFHIGVVKTLVEHKLLPRVIAGSSVGSIICSVLATLSWPELQSFFEDSWYSLKFFDQMGGIFTIFKRVMTRGAVHEIRQLQTLLRHLTNNLTFQEAYDLTGRILVITVCSPRKHEPPRCLNYLTSPHVVIWSAVTASCAFPGLFEAQELMAKDRSGEIVPYHPPFRLGPEAGTSARRWRDGSLEIDLPMMQLKELFNVNHFIVSQANPHIAPLLRFKSFVRTYGGSFAAKLAHIIEMEVKHKCNQVLELGFPLGGLAKLFAQDWEGDVTVVMPATLAQYSKLIQNPSHSELEKAANQGRRCTWEKLSSIKANCGIELALDDCVAILNHMRRLKKSAERAAASSHGLGTTSAVRLNVSRRIPSWNCLARENSTGSLEEELLSDSSGHHHGRNNLPPRKAPDGSDSEPESGDQIPWTRSGGPLMRTTSADTFVDYMHNLDGGGGGGRLSLAQRVSQSNLAVQVQVVGDHLSTYHHHHQDGSEAATSPSQTPEIEQRELLHNRDRVVLCNSSIMVSEGDLLQPEKRDNGIVFNVVKRGDLTPTATNRSALDSEFGNSVHESTAECMQLDSPEKEADESSSESDVEADEN